MPVWFNNCVVTRAGPTADRGRFFVALTDRGGAFSDRFFLCEESIKRELLATALTAISTGNRVEASVEDGAPQFGILYAVYLLNHA